MQLQFPMMETDSGVNDGNYCIVSSGTIHTSAKHFFLIYHFLAFCCKNEVAGSPKVMVALSFF